MKATFLSLILLLNFACHSTSVEEPKLPPLPQNTISPTPIPTPENFPEVEEDLVVWQVLESIVGGQDKNGFDPRAKGNYMVVKRETVPPANREEIKSFPDLPEDLVSDFIEKNKTKGKLRKNGYDLKFGNEIVEFKGSLESVFKSQDKNNKKMDENTILKAVVSVSRVGFTKNHKQSLAYVEFFNPVSGLQKKYCLTTWKHEGAGIWTEDVRWFE